MLFWRSGSPCGPATSRRRLRESRVTDSSFNVEDLQITPEDLCAKMVRSDNLLLVDVREPWEYEICRIKEAELVPLRTLPDVWQRLAQADEVILYCHHGVRSLDAAAWLRGQGVEGARSLAGGIDRWSREIDPSVPRYD